MRWYFPVRVFLLRQVRTPPADFGLCRAGLICYYERTTADLHCGHHEKVHHGVPDEGCTREQYAEVWVQSMAQCL